jgi:hypothetical protein
LLACRAHFGFDFVGDARFLIVENRYLDGWGHLWGNLRHDYFWSSSGNAIPYFRPFTKLSWLVEANLFGRRAAFFHGVQVAWFLVAIAGVGRLARELGLQRRWSLVAATAFAVHPATAEPTALIMARSDVVGAAATVWALATFRTHQRTRSRGALLAHVAFVAIALTSKETCLLIAPLLTAWALAERRSIRATAPTWALTIAYLIVRRVALGAVGQPLTFDALRIFAGIGQSLFALLHLGPTSGLRSIARTEAASVEAIVIALLCWSGVIVLIVCGLRERHRRTALLAGWIVASLVFIVLPRSMWVPGVMDKIALADRWLLPGLIALCLIAARWLQRWVRGRLVLPAMVVFGAWVAMSVAWASVVRAAYANDDAQLVLEERNYEETPERFRTLLDRCRAFDRQIIWALRRNDAGGALAIDEHRARICAPTVGSLMHRTTALSALGRWPEAAVTADALLARTDFEPRQRAGASLLAGIVALENGDAARAETLFKNAARFGERSCSLPMYAARAAFMLGKTDEAARLRDAALACGR